NESHANESHANESHANETQANEIQAIESRRHLPFQLLHFAHDHMRIARKDPSGAPVVEAVSELGVAARQIHWVDAGARHAVVAAGALPALLRFRDVYRALNRVIVHASARLDPAAHAGAGHHQAVVIV